MIEKLKARIKKWAGKLQNPPIVTEETPLSEIALTYPHLWSFFESRYHLTKEVVSRVPHLRELSRQFDLPPSQILFMEIQLEGFKKSVHEISAIEASLLIEKNSDLKILDVRESWEYHFGSIPQSVPFSSEILEELLKTKTKDHSFLLYCHFGIRSLDAAHHLAQNGFKNVYVLLGGIDAWSQQVDPTIPRYTGAYC